MRNPNQNIDTIFQNIMNYDNKSCKISSTAVENIQQDGLWLKNSIQNVNKLMYKE